MVSNNHIDKLKLKTIDKNKHMKNFFIVLKDMYENRTYIHQIEAESIEEATNQTLDIYVDYLSISRDAIKILSVTEGELGDENVVRDLQDAYSLFNLHA